MICNKKVKPRRSKSSHALKRLFKKERSVVKTEPEENTNASLSNTTDEKQGQTDPLGENDQALNIPGEEKQEFELEIREEGKTEVARKDLVCTRDIDVSTATPVKSKEDEPIDKSKVLDNKSLLEGTADATKPHDKTVPSSSSVADTVVRGRERQLQPEPLFEDCNVESETKVKEIAEEYHKILQSTAAPSRVKVTSFGSSAQSSEVIVTETCIETLPDGALVEIPFEARPTSALKDVLQESITSPLLLVTTSAPENKIGFSTEPVEVVAAEILYETIEEDAIAVKPETRPASSLGETLSESITKPFSAVTTTIPEDQLGFSASPVVVIVTEASFAMLPEVTFSETLSDARPESSLNETVNESITKAYSTVKTALVEDQHGFSSEPVEVIGLEIPLETLPETGPAESASECSPTSSLNEILIETNTKCPSFNDALSITTTSQEIFTTPPESPLFVVEDIPKTSEEANPETIKPQDPLTCEEPDCNTTNSPSSKQSSSSPLIASHSIHQSPVLVFTGGVFRFDVTIFTMCFTGTDDETPKLCETNNVIKDNNLKKDRKEAKAEPLYAVVIPKAQRAGKLPEKDKSGEFFCV